MCFVCARLIADDEVEHIQKRVFTRWINSRLQSRNLQVKDLYSDLRDGTVLAKLLTTLTNTNFQNVRFSRSLSFVVC